MRMRLRTDRAWQGIQLAMCMRFVVVSHLAIMQDDTFVFLGQANNRLTQARCAGHIVRNFYESTSATPRWNQRKASPRESKDNRRSLRILIKTEFDSSSGTKPRRIPRSASHCLLLCPTLLSVAFTANWKLIVDFATP